MKISIQTTGRDGRTVGYIVAESKKVYGIKAFGSRGYMATRTTLAAAKRWVRKNATGAVKFVAI